MGTTATSIGDGGRWAMRVRRRLRGEDGVAMIVMMAVLLAVALLATALAGTAQQANSVTVRDSSSKRALAAAEAGLQVATQRYAAFTGSLATTSCLAGANGVTATAPAPECGAVSGDLGRGATYSYVISLPGAACPAAPVDPSTADAGDRCITSTGTVQGVQRRLQTRVSQTPPPPSFPFAGLIGLDSLELFNSNDIDADIGSNGTIKVAGGEVNGNAYVGTGGTVDEPGNISGAVVSVDPFVFEVSDRFDAVKSTTDNSNASITGGRYNATTKAFTMLSGSYELPVVPSGVTNYYFCSFFLGNSVNLTIPSGREVRIYVDSPTRAGSLCTTGGNVTKNNSVNANKGRPSTALKFFLAGCEPGPCVESRSTECDDWLDDINFESDLRFCNSVDVSALFYAPKSYAFIGNSIDINGAMVAKEVGVFNSVDYAFPSDAQQANDVGDGETARTGWFECRPEPTDPADPESGC